MATVLEVSVQVDESTSDLLDVCHREIQRSSTTDQSSEDRNEVALDIQEGGMCGDVFNFRIETVVEQSVCWRHQIKTPERNDFERVDIALDLTLWNTKVVCGLRNHVPFDCAEVVDNITSASRDTTTLNMHVS